MPRSTEFSRGKALALAGAHVAGFGLTLAIFWPGIMTYDAKYVYLDMQSGKAGDWQSPVQGVIWSLVDPIEPGPASFFLLTAAIYWSAFALLSFSVAKRSVAAAFSLPLLALAPPALALLGVIWRDVIFAALWLLAAALAFRASETGRMRFILQTIAVFLLTAGVLLRPNSILAAPIVLALILWPHRFALPRAMLLYVPAAIGFYGVIQFTYYGVLNATKQNPQHSVLVFDLGGISHFTKSNQFPLTWTAEQQELLLNDCYDPGLWDVYWYIIPCSMVMQKLEKDEKIFGTPRLVEAWRRAVTAHPLAYLRHRFAHFWQLLAGQNQTLWKRDLDDPTKPIFTDKPLFMAFRDLHDWLYPTPLFRAGTWFLACIGLFAAAWLKRLTPPGAFVFATSGSAIAYVASYFFIGVAPDFRYCYWAVIAALAGLPVLLATHASNRAVLRSENAPALA